MIKINLVPQAILDKRAQKQQMILVGLAVGVIAVMLASVSFSHYYKGVTLKAELESRERDLKKLAKIVAQVEALEAQAAAVRSRLNVMGDLLKARELYPAFMLDVLRAMPDGVWLLNMVTTSMEKTGGLKVSMESRARSSEDVAEWLRTLADSELFEKPKVNGITSVATGEKSFQMGVTYVPAKEKK